MDWRSSAPAPHSSACADPAKSMIAGMRRSALKHSAPAGCLSKQNPNGRTRQAQSKISLTHGVFPARRDFKRLIFSRASRRRASTSVSTAGRAPWPRQNMASAFFRASEWFLLSCSILSPSDLRIRVSASARATIPRCDFVLSQLPVKSSLLRCLGICIKSIRNCGAV